MIIVGCVISEKKQKHLGFAQLAQCAQLRGVQLKIVDLQRPLEEQGPFHILIHKMTDTLYQAEKKSASSELENLEAYLKAHPDVDMVDRLENVSKLMDREATYQLVIDCAFEQDGVRVSSPTFFVRREDMKEEELRALVGEENSGAQFHYPLLCKSKMAHGAREAHKMCLVFNDKGLRDIPPGSVVQQYICHNGVLFKIFVVGDFISVLCRPSIKNLYSTPDATTVHFDSHEISKPDSASALNEQGAHTRVEVRPSMDHLRELVRRMRRKLGLCLFGVDVIIENGTGNLFVIDVNYFPGYAGVDNFNEVMVDFLIARAGAR